LLEVLRKILVSKVNAQILMRSGPQKVQKIVRQQKLMM